MGQHIFPCGDKKLNLITNVFQLHECYKFSKKYNQKFLKISHEK